MDYYRELLRSSWADRKHHRLEKEVLSSADVLTVVGRGMKEEFEMKRGREVTVVTNGFDEADFLNKNTEVDKEFSSVHIGSFFARINPTGLWRALEELKNENHPLINKLKLKLTGRVAPSVIESIKEYGLETLLSVAPFQPHDQAIRQMKSAAVLLLCVYEDNKFIVTGKLFEYLAAHRPIRFTGSKDGDAARIVLETEAGPVFSREEVQPIKQHILFLYQQFERGELQLKSDQHQKYSHRLLARQVADQLNSIAKV